MRDNFKFNEKPIRDSAANLQRGLETVGGWLYLTDQRLLFESHGFNIQIGSTEIPLGQIEATRLVWTKFLGFLPIFPNSLAVAVGDKEYSFVVSKREQWASAIDTEVSRLRA